MSRLDPADLAVDTLAPFHFGPLDQQVLVTNDAGEWELLDRDVFARLLRGEIGPEDPSHRALHAKGFLRDGYDADRIAARIRRRKASFFRGPHLHILVVTLRCNHACRYCHASRANMDAVQTDMTVATAKRAIDLAFQSPSPILDFEFQGGEPLANWDTVRFAIEYAREKNKAFGKELWFSLVSNLTLMDDDKLAFLCAPDVQVCTSVDGPEDVHDWNRKRLGEVGSFADVTRWIRRFREAYAERGLDPGLFHVEALMTVTRRTLGRARDVVDTYVDLGLPSVHVRSLNPYGFAASAWRQIGYGVDEFLAFHTEVLDLVLERARDGVDLREHVSALFLTKLLTPDDPNHLDLRSPCGAAIGQIAYDHDGRVFTCDEGRMLARMGDDAFAIGRVDDKLKDVLRHPTVRAMAVASTIESLPGCSTCAYQPFCGVCPIHAWVSQRDLFGQQPRSDLCRLRRGQLEMLLRRLRDDADGHVRRTFERWTIQRERGVPVSCAT